MFRCRISCMLYARNVENLHNHWKYSNWPVICYWHLFHHRFISIKTSEGFELATFESTPDQTCAPADDPLERKWPISWFIIGWHYYRLANGREMAAVTTRSSEECRGIAVSMATGTLPRPGHAPWAPLDHGFVCSPTVPSQTCDAPWFFVFDSKFVLVLNLCSFFKLRKLILFFCVLKHWSCGCQFTCVFLRLGRYLWLRAYKRYYYWNLSTIIIYDI